MTDEISPNGDIAADDTAATETVAKATTEESENQPVTAEAVAEVIAEFEQYRERLVNETVAAAKKAKVSKKATMEQLDSELQKIDATIKTLRAQHATLVAVE